jgi:PTS system nitrogen regulatory IIA component
MAKIIGDLLQDDVVIEEIKATDKIGVIREFAEILQATGRVTDAEALVRVLLERESRGSTGIGDGVAIPHGKLSFISDMVVAFGRSSRGVDFQSLDAKPVYLFFLLLTPDNKPGDYLLKALARISRILKNPVLREDLKRTSDRQELKRLIYEEDSKYPQK